MTVVLIREGGFDAKSHRERRPCDERGRTGHPTLTENKLRVAGDERLGETDWQFGMDMCTPLCLKWTANKDVLYSTVNSAQCYMAAGMGGEFGGEWIHVYIWMSPCAIHLKLS